jgi:hypothetical protein
MEILVTRFVGFTYVIVVLEGVSGRGSEGSSSRLRVLRADVVVVLGNNSLGHVSIAEALVVGALLSRGADSVHQGHGHGLDHNNASKCEDQQSGNLHVGVRNDDLKASKEPKTGSFGIFLLRSFHFSIC